MSQGGVRVVARAGRTGFREQAGPSSSNVSNQGRSGSAGRAASTPPLPSPPAAAAVGVGPAPSDDGLTGFELPDATDADGDEYVEVHGASMGFGSTVPAVKQVARAAEMGAVNEESAVRVIEQDTSQKLEFGYSIRVLG